MKKLLFILICFLMISGQIFAQTRIYVQPTETRLQLMQKSPDGFSAQNTIAYFDLQLEQMFTNGQYVEIKLDGYGPSYDIGNPDLPVLNRLIEVPMGAIVEVKVICFNEVIFNLSDYDINKQIMPSQESVSKSADLDNLEFKKNEKVYQADELFNNPIARYHDEGVMRGVRLGRLEISPFAYNPVSGELSVYNNIKLEVKFKNSNHTKTAELKKQYYSPTFNGLFSGLFNYASPVSTREDLSLNSIPMHFVIISDRIFEQTLAPFVAWKKKQGFIVTVKYTDQPEVGATTTSIKNYLQGLYTNPTPDLPVPAFIALVGDVQQIPTFNGTTGSHKSDLYYVTYDGPSDILPDVFIGRMSAQTTAQLTAILDKTLMYEKFEMPDPTYLAKTLSIAGYDPSNAPLYGNGVINYMTHYFNEAHGITPFNMYHPCNGQSSTVLGKINEGVSIAIYSAHCDWNFWDNPRVYASDIHNLTNTGKYGLLVGNCCLSAKFDENECFGEAVIRAVNKGGVGYIGGSNSTYWSEDYWWVTGYGSVVVEPQVLDHGIGSIRAWFHENNEPAGRRAITGSQVNMAGCLAVNESNSSMKKYYWEIYHFLGDPTFMPYIGQMPEMTPSYMPVLQLGMTSLPITNLAPDSYVALTDNGALKVAGFADSDGNIELEFEAFATPTTADLVATTTFYRPYFGHVEIVPASGPYIVPSGYSVVGDDKLTYISTDQEIEVTLKNVGVASTTGTITATISCDDPQITFNTATATCSSIAPDGTAIVTFKVTITHDIVDGKTFLTKLSVTDGSKQTWDSNLSLKAFAPKFSLAKVLIDDKENGSLPKGSLSRITAVVENKGGADAYSVVGDLEINSEFIDFACPEISNATQNLPAGESINFDFYVITNSDMPIGYVEALSLVLEASYGLSYNAPFKVSNSGADNYCMPGNSNCSSYNDKITSLILVKKSDQSVLYSNANPTCVPTIGYTDYTNILLDFIPGEVYTIKVKTGYQNHRVRGWIDFNGNNNFDDNELLFTIESNDVGTEYAKDFTIPQDFTPGNQRFRIRTRDGSTVPGACDTYSYGQTLDYTAVLPELYPRVQNVNAELQGTNITVTWEVPEESTPIGYNIYRGSDILNTTLLADLSFTEIILLEGVYAYNVKAVYDGNKESFAEMSNVICYIIPLPELCEPPLNLEYTLANNAVTITWNEPENIDGVLTGYKIFRNAQEIGETAADVREYIDTDLEDGFYTYEILAVYEHCESEKAELTVEYVGINDPATASFNIFPNPANNSVIVKGERLIKVDFFDIQGRKLSEYNNINYQLQITVNQFESGIYIVKMYSSTKDVAVKRLVIMK